MMILNIVVVVGCKYLGWGTDMITGLTTRYRPMQNGGRGC